MRWGGLGLGVLAVVALAWWWLQDRSPPPPLTVNRGDRLVILGNAFAERMQYFGHFETLLHSRYPDYELVVRDLGWSADEVANRPRSEGFRNHGHTLNDLKPDVVIACFGFNESFAGRAGLAKFEADLDQFVAETTRTDYNGTAPPRLALVSPIAHEDLGRPGLPDGADRNEDLRLYTEATARVAARHSVVFVDLFTPSRKLMENADPKLTIDGVHLTDEGDRRVAALLDEGLFGPRPAAAARVDYEKLRAEVNEKNRQFFADYRAVNGCYIYGSHKKPFGAVNFPDEFAKLRKIIAKRDQRVWAVAQGRGVPEPIDDGDTGELKPVETLVKGPIHLSSPEEELKSFTTAPGFAVNLYASEVEFPDLQKPSAMAFDARGRLWVTTMPSYPMRLPGRPVDDKILILEDAKGAGKADRATVFADGLYLPMGLALGDGGAYVAQQPNVVFLRDAKGEGRADSRTMLLHGFDTADAHRSAHDFHWGPGGDLYFGEGVFNYTGVETPRGPTRCFNGGVFRWEPRTAKLDVYISFKFGNPWGHVWDRWGQDFVGDASTGANYYATAFSGQVDYPRKHPPLDEFLSKQWRPTCGSALVSSRNFPDAMQGDYLLNNCIGFQGVLRYKMAEDGSGFSASAAEPLLQSSDPNFRPVDLRFGPDGALYVCDWYNPVLGHIQYSLRDPSRDRTRGRIWRIAYTGKPLVQRAKVAGASVPELLDLLKAPEDYTREQARLELRLHDAKRVTAGVEKWIAGLDSKDKDYQHHLLEALWVCQHHDFVNEGLLRRLLRSPEPRARAAATRVLCCWRDRVKEPLELLRAQVNDEHPRVRLEAVRALSFFDDKTAQQIAAESLTHDQDYYLKYALEETLETLSRRLGAR
jgi:glucose/arabinose dehydrogenase